MAELSLEQLTELAKALGLDLAPDRLEQVLPEVQRLWKQAQRLREALGTSEEPATRFSPK